jgi:hypothetical protein
MTMRASQNPFRTQRLHGLSYLLHECSWDQLLQRCAVAEFRGAIVGRHGSGKTTLMSDLARRLRDAGETVTELFTNADTRLTLPSGWDTADVRSIVIADGYDSLHPIHRFRMLRKYRRLIITAHARCALPTLYTCEARPEVLAWVATELTGTVMPVEAAEGLLAMYEFNMRDAIRHLYDVS